MIENKQKNIGFDNDKPIFVVSDLHLGDGSSAFVRNGKDASFLRFLDHVAHESGQLLVLGDLLELWRFRLEAVVEHWHGLLDRLCQLQALYIPGNHDAQVADPETKTFHPLFSWICEPLRVTMGGMRFQFMHGHEIDPFIKGGFFDSKLYMRAFHTLFDLRDRVQWIGHEALADLGMGLSESCLRLWQWVTRVSDQVLHPELHAQLLGASRPTLRHVRTHKMLSRYLYHRDVCSYDVAIVGHTHRVGRFDRWYYNSGCWVKPSNSFLKIRPDASVEVFNWIGRHAHPNPTVLGG